MRILIIEDDKDILDFLKVNLKAEGFVVDTAENGDKGEYLASINEYDLIILDLNLPLKNGPEICSALREEGKAVPILILSVEDDIETRVKLFDLGADDFVLKPFFFSELLARIKRLIKRSNGIIKNNIIVENLVLDQDRQVLFYKGKQIYLTRKEYSIIELLMCNPGKIVSRALIMENAWDSEADIFSKAIETHILNIRRKIGRSVIKTIPGRGYMIDLKK